jgi:hypothetical protein
LLKRAKERHAITKPYQIIVMDETGFNMGKVSNASVIGVGTRKTAATNQGSKEHDEHVTLVVGSRADGLATPPALIFKGKYFTETDLAAVPERAHGVKLIKNKSGGSGLISMKSWVETCVVAESPRSGDEWLLLILDQFFWHCDLEFLEYCVANRVAVVGGIPHASHKYQIPDTHYNAPLSRFIKGRTLAFYVDNAGDLDRGTFVGIVHDAYKNVMTKELVLKAHKDNGFTVELNVLEALKERVSAEAASTQAAVGHTPSDRHGLCGPDYQVSRRTRRNCQQHGSWIQRHCPRHTCQMSGLGKLCLTC